MLELRVPLSYVRMERSSLALSDSEPALASLARFLRLPTSSFCPSGTALVLPSTSAPSLTRCALPGMPSPPLPPVGTASSALCLHRPGQ